MCKSIALCKLKGNTMKIIKKPLTQKESIQFVKEWEKQIKKQEANGEVWKIPTKY